MDLIHNLKEEQPQQLVLLKFAGDPNTGLISPAADEIALVTGGVSRLTIDSNGAATFTGNVQVNGDLSVTGKI